MCSKTQFVSRIRATARLRHINGPLSHPHRTHAFRTLSTAAAGSSSGLGLNHDIYLSTSTDPYFNLTFEDWLFRHSPPNKPLLLIYRDSPCVVIGRNQNPWTEVNFSALHDAGIPFLRRRSGGGTVYHDLGNTNFSIHLPRTSFDRHATGQLVLAGVRALGIDANLNSRNDICVDTEKISGSAYKIVNNRAYHHGTMLISTELSTLGAVLRPQNEGIVTKGVGSVRSPVCNLRQFDRKVTHESFTAAVVEQFRREYGVSTDSVIVHDTEETKSVDYIKKGMSELSTWEWMYGQTPEFTQTLQKTFAWGRVTVELHSRHGIILDSRVDAKDAHFPDTEEVPALHHTLTTLLGGKRYGFLDEISSEHALSQPVQELYTWLRQTTNISRR